MRLGFDAKRAFHNQRGLGSYSRALIEGLINSFPEEDYILFTPPPKKEWAYLWQRQLTNLTLRMPQSFWGKHFPSLWRTFHLSSSIQTEKLDFYHGLTGELPSGIERAKIKTVVTIPDLIFIRYPEFYSSIDCRIYKQKYTYATKKADVIISISKQTKQDLVQLLNISEKKIKVLPPSCHSRFYLKIKKPDWEKLRGKLKFPKQYILYVGAFEERKNVCSLIQAFARIKNVIPHHFVFVGGGGQEYQRKMERVVAAHGLGARVLFASFVSDAQLPGVYQNADLFIYPSFFEGWGLPNVEALASGVPVITSQNSCLPESGGPHSLFIDPHSVIEMASSMEKVLSDSNLRDTMVRKGRIYARKFHPEKTTRELMDLYKSLISSL